MLTLFVKKANLLILKIWPEDQASKLTDTWEPAETFSKDRGHQRRPYFCSPSALLPVTGIAPKEAVQSSNTPICVAATQEILALVIWLWWLVRLMLLGPTGL